MKESKRSATPIHALSLLLLIGALSNDSSAAPGGLDLSLDTGSGINGHVSTMVIQPDGKLIIGGYFTTVKGLTRTGLARLNADGSGDSNFLAGIPLPGGAPIREVTVMALQPDGSVVAAHERYFLPSYGLSRFSTNGTPDAAFNTNAPAVLDSLDDDGTVQSLEITALLAQPDGKVLVGGAEYLVRLNPDGTRDASFNADFGNRLYPHRFALQSDGKVLLGGAFITTVDGAVPKVARLNPDGSQDASFNAFTNVSGGGIGALASQPDGKVMIGGSFTAVNGVSRFGLARLNSNGSLDMSFNPATGVNDWVDSVVVQSDGKVLIGRGFNTPNGGVRNGIARLNTNGSLDTTFNLASEWQSIFLTSPALQSDGKLILIGQVLMSWGSRNELVRFNIDGSHDATLDTGTKWLLKRGFEASTIQVQPGGKVLIGGYSASDLGNARGPAFVHGTNIYGVRLNADGSRDQTFTSANFYAYFTNIGPTIDPQVYSDPWDAVASVGVQSDGKVLMRGETFANYCDGSGCVTETFPFLDRAHANGSRDTNFHPGINVDIGVTALAVLSNDKILVAGSFSIGSNRYAVARLNADGGLDNSFAPVAVLPNGTARAWVSSLALQPDGKVMVGGAFTSVNGTSRNGIARINTDGALDSSFNPGTGASGEVHAVALQPDGKVLIGGSFTNVNGTARNRIARLNANGSLDSDFNPGSGPDARVSAIAVQPDGNVLIAGDFLNVNGVLRQYVARLFGDSPVPLLKIMRSGSSLTISWPATFGNFQFQENTNVSPANGWSAVAGTRSTNNNSISVALPATGSRKFFRLSSP